MSTEHQPTPTLRAGHIQADTGVIGDALAALAVVAAPAETSQDDAWPKLDKPAKVGGITFRPGVSTRLVVEAAMRAYSTAEALKGVSAEQFAEMSRGIQALLAPVVPGTPTVDALGVPALAASADHALCSEAAHASLGGKLTALTAQSAAEKQRARQMADAATRAEFERKQSVVRAFFAAAWAAFESDIQRGVMPKAVSLGNKTFREAHTILSAYSWQLPDKGGWQAGGRGIWSKDNLFNEEWQAFLAQCDANGLVPRWTYDYDGGGMDSWFDLVVIPKQGA